MTVVALIAVTVAVALVRAGWSGRTGLAAAGWALAIAAIFALGWQYGAWGIAIGFVVAMAVAIVFVLHAAAVSPARPRRREAASSTALPQGDGYAIARRLGVFVIVVPLSFIASQGLALAIAAAMKGNGSLDANSVATAMFIQPTAWAAIMAWQMTMDNLRNMAVPPMLVALLGCIIGALA